MIAYKDVEWEKANCRGINTELFFLEEETIKHKGLEFSQVRGICFRCPIRQKCLEWAYADKENYGMNGGVSGNERRLIAEKDFDSRLLGALKKDLNKWGIGLEELYEASKAQKEEKDETNK